MLIFQSHLGSIAAMARGVRAGAPQVLSIPPWFDCGLPAARPSRTVLLLSIPPWFDCGSSGRLSSPSRGDAFNPTLVRLRRGLRGAPPRMARLSIPPWFDCGAAGAVEAALTMLNPFNPTLVRLRH